MLNNQEDNNTNKDLKNKEIEESAKIKIKEAIDSYLYDFLD